MSEIRYGLKMKLSSEEIRGQCLDRAQYHRKRAEEKGKELPELKRILDAIRGGKATVADMTIVSNYRTQPEDIVERLEDDIKEHLQKAAFHEFLAKHLFESVYTLDENDVRKLEFLK